MTDVPYAWVSVLLAAAFVWGTVSNGIRFAKTGGKPTHAVGMMFFGVLAIISGWVAWVAVTGPPFP